MFLPIRWGMALGRVIHLLCAYWGYLLLSLHLGLHWGMILPNQVWSIDITYIKLRHGHVYLTAVIDWHSRLIVGWNLSDTLDSSYVIQAVREAVEAHGTPGILNSDQGCQFTSEAYKAALKELHITQSMDGKSRWADNIMVERWFRSLKVEELYVNEYASPRMLRKAIAAYIQQYNAVRPHEALDYDTPEHVYAAGSFPTPSAGLDSLSLAG